MGREASLDGSRGVAVPATGFSADQAEVSLQPFLLVVQESADWAEIKDAQPGEEGVKPGEEGVRLSNNE